MNKEILSTSKYETNIPSSILFIEGITSTDLKLYATVKALSKEKGYCYASNQYLSVEMCMSERNIQKYLVRLKRHMLVKIQVFRTGRSTSRKIFMINDTDPKPNRSVHSSNTTQEEHTEIKHVPKPKNSDLPRAKPVSDRAHIRSDRNYIASRESDRSPVVHKPKSKHPVSSFSENPAGARFQETQTRPQPIRDLAYPGTDRPKDFSFVSMPSTTHIPQVYDWDTFRLEDGKPLSKRMVCALKKYKPWEIGQVMANIEHYRRRIKNHYKPKEGNHERFLQTCISRNYAGEDVLREANALYAQWYIQENKILMNDYKLFKTLIYIRQKNGEFQKLNFSLSEDDFSRGLNNARTNQR